MVILLIAMKLCIFKVGVGLKPPPPLRPRPPGLNRIKIENIIDRVKDLRYGVGIKSTAGCVFLYIREGMLFLLSDLAQK